MEAWKTMAELMKTNGDKRGEEEEGKLHEAARTHGTDITMPKAQAKYWLCPDKKGRTEISNFQISVVLSTFVKKGLCMTLKVTFAK